MSKRPSSPSLDFPERNSISEAPPCTKKSRVGRPKKGQQTKDAVRWSDESIHCLFELRYKSLSDRFDNVKSTQAKKEAYLMLAAELSTRMGQVFELWLEFVGMSTRRLLFSQ